MKNIFISLIVLISILFLGGCEDLDKPIEGQIPTEDVDYTDLSQMYMPVAGIYGFCKENQLVTWDYRSIELFRGDFIVKGGKIADQPQMETVLEKYLYNSTEWFIGNPWSQNYKIILIVNTVLDELDKFRENCSGNDLTLNDQYKAEARFFRALAYHRLARAYGDICWFDSDITSVDLRLSPREEAYDWIIGELKDLREDLLDGHPNKIPHKGAVTRWAADMVLAKAAADIKDYATMEQAAGEIVNSGLFSLHPDYYEMLSVKGELCDESILEMQFEFYNDGGINTNTGAWYPSMGMATTGIWLKKPILGNSRIGGGWGFAIPSKKYVDLMVSRGETVRLTRSIIYPKSLTPKGDSIGDLNNNLKALIAHYEAENLPNGVTRTFTFKDYMESVDRTTEETKYGGYNNIRLFRYADALLLYAEALVHNNKNGDKYVNQVRARAVLGPWTNATIDQIIEERGIELEQEWGGDRFYDLVRLGKTSELGSNFKAGENEFLPTPQLQIDNHPGLLEAPVSDLFPTTFGD